MQLAIDAVDGGAVLPHHPAWELARAMHARARVCDAACDIESGHSQACCRHGSRELRAAVVDASYEPLCRGRGPRDEPAAQHDAEATPQQRAHSMKRANALLRRVVAAALQERAARIQAVQSRYEARRRLPSRELPTGYDVRATTNKCWGPVTARQYHGAVALQLLSAPAESDVRSALASALTLPYGGVQQYATLDEVLRTVCATTQTPLLDDKAAADLRCGGGDEAVLCMVRAFVMPLDDTGIAPYSVGIGRFGVRTHADGSESAMLVIICTDSGTSARVCHPDECAAVRINVRGTARYLRASATELYLPGPAPVCVVQVPVWVEWAEECDFAVGAPQTQTYVDGSEDVRRVRRDTTKDVLATQLLCFAAGADGSVPPDFVAVAEKRIAAAARVGPSRLATANNRREQ